MGSGSLNKIVSALLLVAAIFLLILGVVFLIAGDLVNMVTGGVMILVALILVFIYYQGEKIKAAQPKLVNQTFNVKMEGSGQMAQKELKCRSCGAPLEDKDLKVISGGIMVSCPYCGTAYALEEAPKW